MPLGRKTIIANEKAATFLVSPDVCEHHKSSMLAVPQETREMCEICDSAFIDALVTALGTDVKPPEPIDPPPGEIGDGGEGGQGGEGEQVAAPAAAAAPPPLVMSWEVPVAQEPAGPVEAAPVEAAPAEASSSESSENHSHHHHRRHRS